MTTKDTQHMHNNLVQSSPDEFDAVAKTNPYIVQCSINYICNTITSFF